MLNVYKKIKSVSDITEIRKSDPVENIDFNDYDLTSDSADDIIKVEFKTFEGERNIIYYQKEFYLLVGDYDSILSKLKESISDFISESNTYCYCDDCGEVIFQDDSYFTKDESFVCEYCLDRNYFKCSDCEEYCPDNDRNKVVLSNGDYICQGCYDNGDYGRCSHCGDIMHVDYLYYCEGCEDYHCEYCHDQCDRREEESDLIHCNTYKPKPIFHGKGKLQMGFELEVENLSDKNECVYELDSEIESNLIYFKKDGSLSDKGVEIVSHPCTLDFYRNNFPFDDMLKTIINYDGKSHDAGNCGLHIHFSKDYFTNYELSATRILYLFEKFWTQFATFSRRKDFGYCQKNDYLNYTNPKIIKNIKRYATEKGRYYAVNLMPENTIEFRLWRGTLIKSTILATLEITHLICVIAENTSLLQLQKMSFEDFKKLAKEYKLNNLTEYFKTKIM